MAMAWTRHQEIEERFSNTVTIIKIFHYIINHSSPVSTTLTDSEDTDSFPLDLQLASILEPWLRVRFCIAHIWTRLRVVPRV
jgi:hypothetical protein